ncbi:MAG TPA: hypothetical protein VEW46_15100 [Pyrinomonadaceae bacterium]|nr:hypothetical protein [Pyrinomonadaceae bacterium]
MTGTAGGINRPGTDEGGDHFGREEGIAGGAFGVACCRPRASSMSGIRLPAGAPGVATALSRS